MHAVTRILAGRFKRRCALAQGDQIEFHLKPKMDRALGVGFKVSLEKICHHETHSQSMHANHLAKRQLRLSPHTHYLKVIWFLKAPIT